MTTADIVAIVLAAITMALIPFCVWVVKGIYKLNLEVALIKQEREFMSEMRGLLFDLRSFLKLKSD